MRSLGKSVLDPDASFGLAQHIGQGVFLSLAAQNGYSIGLLRLRRFRRHEPIEWGRLCNLMAAVHCHAGGQPSALSHHRDGAHPTVHRTQQANGSRDDAAERSEHLNDPRHWSKCGLLAAPP